MKLLINLTTTPGNPIPREKMAAIVADFRERLTAHLSSGQFDRAFNVQPAHGFIIANVESVEAAWTLLMGYKIFPYWTVKMTPLVDAMAFSDLSISAGSQRNAS